MRNSSRSLRFEARLLALVTGMDGKSERDWSLLEVIKLGLIFNDFFVKLKY